MKPKTIRIVHRVVTLIFALLLLMAGVTEAMQHESGREIMRHLGYPDHVLIILGIGKILAAIALIQQKHRTLREWAYAGITFNLIGAFVARLDAGDSLGLILSPLIFLSVMFLSYFTGKAAASAGNRQNEAQAERHILSEPVPAVVPGFRQPF